MKRINYLFIILASSGFSLLVTPTFAATTSQEEAISRGEYVFHIGGCASCHTQDQPLAGGVELATPFGVFIGPNISPDNQYGIGGWSNAQFIKAMREGVSPKGEHYYPAFPYTSYVNMPEQDLLDLKSYLDAQEPVSAATLPHKLKFPYNQRTLLGVWKLLNTTDKWVPDPNQSAIWNRGGYLANGPSHCTQCHSPRNFIGGLQVEAGMVGNKQGPEGESVPPLLGMSEAGFGMWTKEDIAFSLEIGMTPEGDFLGGSMSHVLENTTGKMTAEDIEALSTYLYLLNNP